MLAHPVLALALVVRLYDAYGVSAAELAAARATGGSILGSAGIAVTWVACPCAERVGPAELIVRVIAATAPSERDSLGFSYIDLESRSGTLATVFADRVRTRASEARVSSGELLGRAMAHEIGHLILGTIQHDSRGLMRGRWTASELQKNSPWDWSFPRETAIDMDRALRARLRELQHPDEVAALRPGSEFAGLFPPSPSPGSAGHPRDLPSS
jgi:hypothetical protein